MQSLKYISHASHSPLEVVTGVLHDGRVAVGLVAAVRHVHVELARPCHEAVAHVLGPRLVLVQLAQEHSLVETVDFLYVAEYYFLLQQWYRLQASRRNSGDR